MGNTYETQWRMKLKNQSQRKHIKYLGVEGSHNAEHKNEKGICKKIKIGFEHKSKSKK
jgi:hypothetical protein